MDDSYQWRTIVFKRIIYIPCLIILVRLFYLQVVCGEYKLLARRNFVKANVTYPARAHIVDRNGQTIARNALLYDLYVVPRYSEHNNIDVFCSDFHLTHDDYNKKMRKAKRFSNTKPSTFIRDISIISHARLIDKMISYRGFFFKPRLIREYPSHNLGNIIGYLADSENNMSSGQSGIEKMYDSTLCGTKGVEYDIVNVYGARVKNYAEGKYDIGVYNAPPLSLTVDSSIQTFCEGLLHGMCGGIVVLKPSNGDILAIVSSPTYDPNMLVRDNDFRKHYTQLMDDSNRPLFNRAIMATYPAGSMFKLIQALIALDKGCVGKYEKIVCTKKNVKCHTHPNPVNMHDAIKYSCNEYFYTVFQRIINGSTIVELHDRLNEWSRSVSQFGFGKKLGIDLPSEKPGYVPNSDFYDDMYGKCGWSSSTIRSLDIGQGELLATPLQMANLAAIVSNGGFFFTPHVTKTYLTTKHTIHIDKTYFDFITDAMRDCITNGSGRNSYVKGMDICGKTATIQNSGNDHSAFIGFSKEYDVALSVLVENAGWGSGVAATTAGRIFKFIKRIGIH